ncbi:S-layer homology domain-containing protein [Sporomusa sp.]|uniref:S-layer homology domain-containing protein n=1 Tax=Sporomusa sp. TaxID=2078658 RepID=UPI002B6F025A|nr:S-layer homology domain-containing protein [Sporomusa sp.]HWR10032.1 S-layer homology domain-containing protein [Sporomusa sp.]
MKKKLLKTAICTALTVAFAVPAFANPFADVPTKHWAYDAVNKLAATGIVSGYGDGTFKGDKTLTRYEMAQIVATAMGKVSTVDQKVIVDKLASEFATELNSLGVKVDGIQKQLDNQIKFSGEARVQYDNATEDTSYRFRLGATGKINDDTKLNARLTTADEDGIDKTSLDNFGSPSIDRFNIETKLGAVDTVLGKQDLKLGKGLLYNSYEVDGAAITGAKAKLGGLTLAYDNNGDTRVQAAEYQNRLLGTNLAADYLKIDNAGTANEYAALSTDVNVFGKKVGAEYVRNVSQKANAYRVGTDILGARVSYINFDVNALPEQSGFNFAGTTSTGFGSSNQKDKGFQVTYDRNLAKNVNLELDYKNLDVAGDQTKATVNVKF